jgi:hypothetical protein
MAFRTLKVSIVFFGSLLGKIANAWRMCSMCVIVGAMCKTRKTQAMFIYLGVHNRVPLEWISPKLSEA